MSAPSPTPSTIDWDRLRAAARSAVVFAYAPYSGLQVGAAALLDDESLVSGCNVENASLGLGVCAEVTMVGRWKVEGRSSARILAVAATDQLGRNLTPCGRCRQILMEHAGPDCLIDGPTIRPLRELLPDWFGPEQLP